jgi:hypothetical protein
MELLVKESPAEKADDDESHRAEHGDEQRVPHLNAPSHHRKRDPPADDTLQNVSRKMFAINWNFKLWSSI